jgi:hypothetical protein|tara:strand:+ start:304 stop:522 length:219 start_codon:yes stop_codon:yes gene_type:complete
MFKVGDLVRCLMSYTERKGALGMIVGIDFNPHLHTFPMYIVMFVDSGLTAFMHPNDIEGVSLVNRKSKGEQR